MVASIEAESTLTDRYQTTVPETVRRALGLQKRDKVRYTIRPGGDVVVSRAVVADDDDPALGQFLHFLAQDIAHQPAHLRAVDIGLVTRVRSLTGNIEVDLDAPLSADDE